MLVSHYAFIVEEVLWVPLQKNADCGGRSFLARKWRLEACVYHAGSDCSSVLITSTNQLKKDFVCVCMSGHVCLEFIDSGRNASFI